MISLDKMIVLTPLQKIPKNVGDLGKLNVAKGFKKLPKVQSIAQSGHTACQGVHQMHFQLGSITIVRVKNILIC